MTKTEILNHLNARGGEAVNNEIAAKIAAMTGLYTLQTIYENEDRTDRYIHKHFAVLLPGYNEQIIAEAESITDELEFIKVQGSYNATFTVSRVEFDEKTATGKDGETVLLAVYDYELHPEWEELQSDNAVTVLNEMSGHFHDEGTDDEDTDDEDHEFCTFVN